MTKIAIVCPPDLPIPSFEGYGGIQRSIYDFIFELSRRGNYEILLFASGDSQISHIKHVTLLTNIDQALWGDLVVNENFLEKSERDIAQKARLNEKYEDEYTDFIWYELQKQSPHVIIVMYDNLKLLTQLAKSSMFENVIYSLRNTSSEQKKELIRNYPTLKIVALSEQHKLDYGNISNISVIPWGLDFNLYDFCEQPLAQSEESPNENILREWQAKGIDYLVMVGAIGIHKSQATAIQIAKRANMRLIIAGTPQDRLTLKKTTYFKNELLPQFSEEIVYFGNAGEQQKIDLMRFAKALIAPFGFEFLAWKEPFGRVMVESMACGTPVLAFRHGSPIDIVAEGISGYLFETVEEAAEKILLINSINRYMVRKFAEEKFNIKKVVDEYEKIFRKIY